MLEALMPNWSLMKHPGNWLLIGFILFIMVTASHILFGRNIAKDNT